MQIKKPFDVRTHIRHPKSGRVIAEQHYSLIVSAKPGGGTEWCFERPPGSGLFYYRNGEMAKEKSAEGVKKQAQELADANKTDFEKASEKLAQAQSEHAQAKSKFEAEQKAKLKEQSLGGK